MSDRALEEVGQQNTEFFPSFEIVIHEMFL